MSEPSKPTGLWAYAESMQSAHEAYVRRHSAVLPVYEYDPADDGPEVEVIRLANADRTLRAKAKHVADFYLTVGAAYMIEANILQ